MIRQAKREDLSKLITLARSFHKRSTYRDYELDEMEMYRSLSGVLSQKLGFLHVADHYGVLTGMLAGAVQSLWFSRDQYASDLIFVSRREGDGDLLIKAFVDWAFTFPRVRECTLAVSSGIHPKETGELYERHGFEYLGPMFMMTKDGYEQSLERHQEGV